jgi:basic membrane protein A
MRSRSLALSLLTGVALVIGACTGGGSPSASAPSGASPSAASPSAASSSAASPSDGSPSAGSASPSGSAASPSGEPLNVGVVTDVGQLEDKSFNQFTNEGALAAATALGGDHDVIVTANISDYARNIQTFVDRDFDVIVTAGSLLGTDTAKAALANPEVFFVGIDQFICVDAQGTPNFADCSGDPAQLMPNYQGVIFAEEQAGYLVGIIAANISESNVIGAVAGTNVPAVVRYIAGYEAGAKSVKADINVLKQEADPDPAKGFNNPGLGRSLGTQMIGQDADVLFQVAGGTGVGVLEAACDADIHGIGVDVDQALAIPTAADCIVTSAEKKLKEYTELVVRSIADGTFEPGNQLYNAASEPAGIGISPYHDNAALITPEIQAQVDEAFEAMKAGTLEPPKS